MTLDRDIEAGRERLKQIQREAGYDPEGEEPFGYGRGESLSRYVELLEAAVVGQHAAARAITKTLRMR